MFPLIDITFANSYIEKFPKMFYVVIIFMLCVLARWIQCKLRNDKTNNVPLQSDTSKFVNDMISTSLTNGLNDLSCGENNDMNLRCRGDIGAQEP